jgi:DNA-binding winged helix-turn-helix (wHTH) protein
MLNVQWKQQEIGTIYKLINHLGDVVSQGQISDSQTQVDVSRLTSGIYMLSTSLSTTKILVAH